MNIWKTILGISICGIAAGVAGFMFHDILVFVPIVIGEFGMFVVLVGE
jgi:hypothetical protein